jgi:hypothetical protein
MSDLVARNPDPPRMTVDEFTEACESYEGFCTTCNEVTKSNVEPDARRYECESCGERTVYGMEEALMSGFIRIR